MIVDKFIVNSGLALSYRFRQTVMHLLMMSIGRWRALRTFRAVKAHI